MTIYVVFAARLNSTTEKAATTTTTTTITVTTTTASSSTTILSMASPTSNATLRALAAINLSGKFLIYLILFSGTFNTIKTAVAVAGDTTQWAQ